MEEPANDETDVADVVNCIVNTGKGWYTKFSLLMHLTDKSFQILKETPLKDKKLKSKGLGKWEINLHARAIKQRYGDCLYREGSQIKWELQNGDGVTASVKGEQDDDEEIIVFFFSEFENKNNQFLTTLVQKNMDLLKKSRELQMDGNVSFRLYQMRQIVENIDLCLPDDVVDAMAETLRMGPASFSLWLQAFAKKDNKQLVKDMVKLVHGDDEGTRLLQLWNEGRDLESHRRELEKVFFGKVVAEMEDIELYSHFVGEKTPRFVLNKTEKTVMPVLRFGTWNLNMVRMSSGESGKPQQLHQRLRGKMPELMRCQYVSLIWKAIVESDCDIVTLQEISGETVINKLKESKPEGYGLKEITLEETSFGGKEVHAFIFKESFISLQDVASLGKATRSSVALLDLSKINCVSFVVCNVHLKYKKKTLGIKDIISSLIDQSVKYKTPVFVVMGDFNGDTVTGNFEVKISEKVFNIEAEICVPAHCPTSISGKPLDNIIFFYSKEKESDSHHSLNDCCLPQCATRSPMKHMRSQDWWGPQGNWLSDHFLVYSDVYLKWKKRNLMPHIPPS